jgi:hypothetical protein
MKCTNWLGLSALSVAAMLFSTSCQKNITSASDTLSPAVAMSGSVSQTLTTTASQQKFVAYYVTDGRNPTYKLTDIPKGVDIVVLFVIKWPAYLDTLNNPPSGATIGAYPSYGAFFKDIKTLQARGIKVVQNIDDEDTWQTTTPAGYATAAAFALKMKQELLDTLKLDGISLDIEHSGAPPDPIPPFPPYDSIGYYGWYSYSMEANQNFLNCIGAMTKYFGTTAPNTPLLMSATGLDCYSWNAIASRFVNNFNYFGVQAYGRDSTTDQLMNNYATGTNKIPSSKMMYGVNGEDVTTLGQDTGVAKWVPTQGQKGAVFVYSFNGSPSPYGQDMLKATKEATVTAAGTGVVLYQNTYYGGAATKPIPKGKYNLAALKPYGFVNDWASSIKIPSGWTVTMYAGDELGSTSWTLTGNNANFTQLKPSANDKVSSITIK